MSDLNYFATAAKGLESVLAEELIQLGFTDASALSGGVAFSGNRGDGYRACLWLRTANRVLQRLKTFPCASEQALYDAVRAIPWEEHLTPAMTLAVDANLRSSRLTHSRYVALKTKDAIVDRLRDRCGQRPNVDPRQPDLRINIHLVDDTCTVSLDLAGFGLHRRGYRHDANLAPLRETLAAGLVQLSGWNGQDAFVDPMCGSGTMPLEAALLSSRTAPGLLSDAFSFQKWPDFQEGPWKELLTEATETALSTPDAAILGADRDPRALRLARRNAARLSAATSLTWQQTDFASLAPPAPRGILLCNPPYGERLGDEQKLASFYKSIGDTLKQRWTGWTAWIFTGNLRLAKRIGLKPSRRLVLYNGPLECRLLKYELY